MSSSTEGSTGILGASVYARELSKRRVTSSTTIQTPSLTPVTPVAPTTPMLAAHIFADGNMMEDLQLAAELGKTLLERNKDLEGTIRELRTLVDDKTQEIEYLSKQTAALREVNDSRLRIYEQLEISIQDLEKSNQRLQAETAADKRKIRSLSGTVEQLEAKCEELQKCLEETRKTQHSKQKEQQERGRGSGRRSFIAEEHCLRRSQSCENTPQSYEDLVSEGSELRAKIVTLQERLKMTQQERLNEARKREDLEIENACLAQENAALHEQVMVFKDKETHFKSFDDELASLDDTTSGKFCRKCMGGMDETGSNLTVQDFVDDIEDMEPSFDTQGECALVRLKNGGYAWGSQESLASMGQVVNCAGSNSSSPQTEASEAPYNSLLSELDTQYRILIEKYEALVEARERTEEEQTSKNGGLIDSPPPPHTTLVDSGIDEISGPMGLVMTEVAHHGSHATVNVGMRCQRCTTCSCDLKPSPRPKSSSNTEDLSEVETSSSGFSEGESRFCTKMTQTDSNIKGYGNDDIATTPTPLGNNLLDLTSSINPCDKRFAGQPDYREIFHEIFEMLKKERKDIQVGKVVRKKFLQYPELERQLNRNTEALLAEDDTVTTSTTTTTTTGSCSDIHLQKENEANKGPNVIAKSVKKKEKKVDKNEEKRQTSEQKDVCLKEEDQNDTSKPPARPDFLDLETASRCSSRSRRRKRSNRNRQKSDEQPNPLQQLPHQSNHRHNDCHINQQSEQPLQRTDLRTRVPETTRKSSRPLPTIPPAAAETTDVEASHSKDTTKQRDPRPLSNSSRGRCEHSSKSRKSRHHRHKQQQPLKNKHLNNVLSQHPSSHSSRQPVNNAWSGSHAGATNTADLPSVQVAKLIKFEKSYAEVLKSKPPRDTRLH